MGVRALGLGVVGLRIPGFGFRIRVWDSVFDLGELKSNIWGSGFWVWGCGPSGIGFRVRF